jgi:hypothetical protein
MFSLYLFTSAVSSTSLLQDDQATSPIIFDCFDDEAECGRNCVDVLAHDILDYRSFTAVVESTRRWSVFCSRTLLDPHTASEFASPCP